MSQMKKLIVVAALTACGTEPVSDLKSGWIPGTLQSDGTGHYVLEWTCAPKQYDADYDDGEHRKQDEYCEWDDFQKDSAGVKVCQFHTNFTKAPLATVVDELPFHGLGGTLGHNPTNSLAAAVDLTSKCYAHPTGSYGVKERHSDPKICAKVREWRASGLSYRFANAAGLGKAPDPDRLSSALPGALKAPVVQIAPLHGNLPAGCSYVANSAYPSKSVMRCDVKTPGVSCLDLARRFQVGIVFDVTQPG